MAVPNGNMWTILPNGQFHFRVLLALIEHQWFVRLRWIFASLAALLLAIEHARSPVFSRPVLLWAAVGALVPINFIWTIIGRRLRKRLRQPDATFDQTIHHVTWFVNAQMGLDILVLTVVLRYSGGIENPMAIFYLFHMLIAALLLKPLNALLQGTWAVLLFFCLAAGECFGLITPHYQFIASEEASGVHKDLLHVLSCVGVLAAGVVGTLYFTLQISTRLEEQEDELFEANAALRASRDSVERLQQKRSQFLRTAAHQLKSPLTGIEMLAGLIRDGVVDDSSVNKIVPRIIARCREAILQVGELLTLERVEHAPENRHCAEGTIVRSALGSVMNRFATQIETQKIEFSVLIDCDAEMVIAVALRDFEDCIGNLLDNALKYTPAGGQVCLSARQEGEGVRVEIRDNGMGIAGSFMDNIFEPFHRGNQVLAANIPGSGLGLTIVREVVDQANGRITVRSDEGRGTEFVLWFPKKG